MTERSRIIVLAFLLICLTILATACGAAPLKGIDLAKERAPDFRLSDQNGNLVSLADLRGKVVVLTFLYTVCPDECPLIAAKLRAAADQLGDAMERVAFVAVSTDPQNDTPTAVQSFLRAHRLEKELRYLTGAPDQLQPVWAAYYIGTVANSSSRNSIAHSSRVIVIDPAGNQRADFRADFIPADLVFDVRALLKE